MMLNIPHTGGDRFRTSDLEVGAQSLACTIAQRELYPPVDELVSQDLSVTRLLNPIHLNIIHSRPSANAPYTIVDYRFPEP